MNNKICFSQFWRSKIRVSVQSSSAESPLSVYRWLSSRCCLSWQGAERGSELLCGPYKNTDTIDEGSTFTTSSNSIISQRPHHLIPSYWGLRFQHINLVVWWGHLHSVHNKYDYQSIWPQSLGEGFNNSQSFLWCYMAVLPGD